MKSFNNNHKNILFIGNYFTAKRGSKPISLSIANNLKSLGYSVGISSNIRNKIFRFLDILLHFVTTRSHTIHIDVFSNNYFRIPQVLGWLRFIKGKHFLIMNLHGGRLPEYYLSHKQRVYSTLKKADLLLSPSMVLVDFFRKNIPGLVIKYLPNPVSTEKFFYSFNNTNKYRILWVRAFNEDYQPEIAVKAFKLITSQFPAATLTMVGPDKGLLNKTKELIQELNLTDAIKIVGPVNNDKLTEFYHSHNVFLNTTRYESFGVAVMEAAACGIPIVSTKVGELPLLWVQDKEILFSEGQTAEGLAEQVIRLFENRELCKQLSSNARRKAESFDWEVIKEKWVEILR